MSVRFDVGFRIGKIQRELTRDGYYRYSDIRRGTPDAVDTYSWSHRSPTGDTVTLEVKVGDVYGKVFARINDVEINKIISFNYRKGMTDKDLVDVVEATIRNLHSFIDEIRLLRNRWSYTDPNYRC